MKTYKIAGPPEQRFKIPPRSVFQVFVTNMGSFLPYTFATLAEAKARGEACGFEFQIFLGAELVYAWTQFGGGRDMTQGAG